MRRRRLLCLALPFFLLSSIHAQESSVRQVRGKAILDSERVSEEQYKQNLSALDRLFFEDNIQPYLGQTCALAACHGGVRAARLHFDRPDINGHFTPDQSRQNYASALWYVAYRQPTGSRLLLKPLDRDSGGLEHSGGNKVEAGSHFYSQLVEWIKGAKVGNVAPSADAGIEQRIQIGTTVKLDGSGSWDRNGDALTHSWKMLLRPPKSKAKLQKVQTVSPFFVPDIEGNYLLQLVVNDGKLDSPPDTVLVKGFSLLKGMLAFEAENAALSPPMQAFEADKATGRKYIAVPVGAEGTGKARYSFNISEAGDYYLYGKFNVDSEEQDSLLVTLGSGGSHTWVVKPTLGSFLFDRMSQNRVNVSGNWRIANGVYQGTASSRTETAIMRTDHRIADGTVEVTATTRNLRGRNEPLRPKNALILFDYVDEKNTKFAGFYDDDSYTNVSTLWNVVGPFSNEDDKGFDIVYPPEQEKGNIELTKSYPGVAGRSVTWQKQIASDGYGQQNYFINLDKITQVNNVVAYALAVVDIPTAQKGVEISMGHDDGAKVWVNDRLVYTGHFHRPCVPDQYRFRADFRKGKNKILVKVDEGYGEWGFGMRRTNNKNNFIAIGELKDGKRSFLVKKPVEVQTGQAYQVKLILKGGRAALTWGREEGAKAKVACKFARPFEGWTGIAAQGGRTVFDNLSVRDARGRILLSDTFDVARGEPLAFSLKKGKHTLELSSLDPEVQLDRLMIVEAGSEERIDVNSRQFVREAFLDLFQRGPSDAELLYAAGLKREQLIDFMFSSYDFYDRWYTDQLYYMFLLRRFDPRAPWMLQIPSHLHNGTLSELEAIKKLATCQYFHFRNLGPDNYVNVAFEQLLGRLPKPEELKIGKRMYNGNVMTLFGMQGTNQYDVADIVLMQKEAYAHLIKRMYKRYFPDEIDGKELERLSEKFRKDPYAIVDIQKRWLLNKKYQKNSQLLRPKSDIQFIRTLYMDLLDREPTQEEFDYVQNAIQSFADPIPLRSVIVRIFIDSGAINFPDKAELKKPEEWVIDQYLRFLCRQPTPKEVRACLGALRQPNCNTETIVQGILSSNEYQYY